MPRPSRVTVSVLPWAAATALLCATVAAGPNTAWAQTARDLECNRCVNTRDLDKKAVSRSRIRGGAVNFRKLDPSVEDAIRQDRVFDVTLDSDGAEATLVTQGPLRMFTRCFVNNGGQDRIQIGLTSTVDGWFVLDSGTIERAAGEEVLFLDSPTATGNPLFLAFQAAGAAAPDGSLIYPAFNLTFGLNVFGHACLVSGSATAVTGAL